MYRTGVSVILSLTGLNQVFYSNFYFLALDELLILETVLLSACVDLETFIKRCGTDAVLVSGIDTRWCHRVVIRMKRTLVY